MRRSISCKARSTGWHGRRNNQLRPVPQAHDGVGGAAGAAGAGATITGGSAGEAGISTTSESYGALATGATTEVIVTGTHTVLVTLTTTCSNSTTNDGCFMSFTANNGASTTTASDNNAVGTQKLPVSSVAVSASYLVTVANGSTTFTASYRAPNGGTATFQASRIIVQIF